MDNTCCGLVDKFDSTIRTYPNKKALNAPFYLKTTTLHYQYITN